MSQQQHLIITIATCFPSQVLCTKITRVTRTNNAALPLAYSGCRSVMAGVLKYVYVLCAAARTALPLLPQGRAACRKLESKLAAELQLHPDSDYRTRMLSRVKSNLGECKWDQYKAGTCNVRASVSGRCANLCVPCVCAGWYAKKAPQNARAEECPVDVQHLCAKDKQNTVEATVSEL